MATYRELRSGSTGDEVKRLQALLNRNGYNLSEDGIFGSRTQSAVRDYQSKNGLGVDGIVGSQTWGALTGGSSASQTGNTQATTPLGTEYNPLTGSGAQADLERLEGSQPTWAPSQALSDAYAQLEAYRNQKPGEYKSGYQAQLNELYEKIMGRGNFTYDFNADPLYQMYKDQYTAGGKRAMQDTVGQVSALTGGYGNSYAQSAGQQAYNQYMQQLGTAIPALQQQAYDQWTAQGNDLLSKLSTVQGLDEAAYGRYRDQVSDYYTNLQLLADAAQARYGQEYGEYADALKLYLTNRNYYRQKALEEAAAAASSGGSSSGGSPGKSPQDEPAGASISGAAWDIAQKDKAAAQSSSAYLSFMDAMGGAVNKLTGGAAALKEKASENIQREKKKKSGVGK